MKTLKNSYHKYLYEYSRVALGANFIFLELGSFYGKTKLSPRANPNLEEDTLCTERFSVER